MLRNLMLRLNVIASTMLTSGVSNEITDDQQAILDKIKIIGTVVVSVAFAIGVIFVAIGLIKSGIILADADKAGPEQTAKAKTAIKNNVIALIIMAVPFIVLLSGFQTWIINLIKGMWWG